MKILSFGEILWDVYPDNAYIGGAPLNFGAHLAKQGAEVYMLSAVGKDELGSKALSVLEGWGIRTDYVKTLDCETGKCLVTLDENSVPSYNLLSHVAWDFIDGDVNEAFDVLYFGTLALRSQTNLNTVKGLLAKGGFKEVFVDVNIRPPFYSAKTVSMALENATILKISDEELETVVASVGLEVNGTEETARAIARTYENIKILIITLGAKGSLAYDVKNDKFFYAHGIKVEVASTVGAGDSFSASFLRKYLEGESTDECLAYATKISAFVVSKYDAVPDYE